MENLTLGLLIGGLGASTIIGFIANVWKDTSNAKQEIPALKKEVEDLKKAHSELLASQNQFKLDHEKVLGEVRSEFSKINSALDFIVKKLDKV